MKYGVALTGISVYSVNLRDPETDRLFHMIRDELTAREHVLQMHGFNLDKATRTVNFDLVISFDVRDRRGMYDEIVSELNEKHPDYTFCVTLDSDISD